VCHGLVATPWCLPDDVATPEVIVSSAKPGKWQMFYWTLLWAILGRNPLSLPLQDVLLWIALINFAFLVHDSKQGAFK
jgi:hypothetical protein